MTSDEVFTLQPDEPTRRSRRKPLRPSRMTQGAFPWSEGSPVQPKADANPPAPPSSLGAQPPPPSPTLTVEVSPSPVPIPPPPIPSPPKVSTSKTLGTHSPSLLAVNRPLREIVERYLLDRKAPFVNVDEAKRALFAGAKLRSFHFVVYQKEVPNWLLWAAQLRKESRQDLLEWQKIFGDGFVAMVAKQANDGALKFQTLAGDAVELK